MCLAAAGRVVTIDHDRGTAIAEVDGRRIEISLAPLVLGGDSVAPGDWVLLHTGLAMAVITEREAHELAATTAALTVAGGIEP